MRKLYLFFCVLLVLVITACTVEFNPLSITGNINGTPFNVEVGGRTLVPSTQLPTPTNTITFPATVVTATPLPTATHTPMPPIAKGDWALELHPNFDVTTLTEDQQYAYEQVIEGINNPNHYPYSISSAGSGDLYQCGRTVNEHVTAIVSVYRYTGDIQLLDHVKDVMDAMWSQVQDWNNDGYKNLRWLHDKTPGRYNSDKDPMDSILCHSLIAFWAYVANETPGYEAEAQKWIDYLQNDWMGKYDDPNLNYKYKFENTIWDYWSMPFKDLTHPYVAEVRYWYYLYQLFGDADYLTRANAMYDVLIDKVFIQNGNTFEWDHRVPGFGHDPLYCQPSEYAQLTTTSIIDLALEGFGAFADDAYMRYFANTYTDNVLAVATANKVSGDVCGGNNHSDPGIWLIGSGPGIAMWDTSGRIEEVTYNQWDTMYSYSPVQRSPQAWSWIFLSRVTGGYGLRPNTALSFSLDVESTPYLERVIGEYSNNTTEVWYEVTPVPTDGFNTPTPEPTYTPSPTVTPVPELCYGTTAVSNLSIRKDPLVSGEYLGKWDTAGTRIQILQVGYDVNSTDEWVYAQGLGDKKGWSAAYYQGEDYITYDTSQGCLDVRSDGIDIGERQPAAVGFHSVVPEKTRAEQRRAEALLQANGWNTFSKAVETYENAVEAAENGSLSVHRWKSWSGHQGDCPASLYDPIGEADAQWEKDRWLVAALPINAMPEPVNECGFWYGFVAGGTPENIDIFLARVIEKYSTYGHRAVIMSDFGCALNTDNLREMPKTLEAMDTYDAILGLHVYGMWKILPGGGFGEPQHLWDSAKQYDPICIFPQRVLYPVLVELGYPHIQMALTELGTLDGNGPHGDAELDDLVWYVKETACDKNLIGSAWWSAGGGTSQWSLDGQMVELARRMGQSPKC